MANRSLKLITPPTLQQGTLLLALTGWMDGGSVSSGTLRQFMENRSLVHAGRIKPAGFYIDNFPGTMEVTAMFRPHVRCADGLVEELEWATNDFYADPDAGLAFFIGKEPNLNWVGFARCIFDMAQRMGIRRIIFMGSFGGSVPHTREPRLYGSVSEPRLLPLLKKHDLRPSNYEGPASFATYLLTLAPRFNMEMLSIAAEIPGYLEGVNPLSIEAVTRRLAAILGIAVNLDALRATSNEWEQQVTEAVEKDEDLAATVRQMEEAYDNELIGESPGN